MKRTVLLILVLSALPFAAAEAQFAIVPVVDCVTYDAAMDTVTAYFGYYSSEAVVTPVPLGTSNFFAPLPPFRGQPVSFSPGWNRSVFAVTFSASSSVTWNLLGIAATASNDPALYCSGCASPADPSR